MKIVNKISTALVFSALISSLSLPVAAEVLTLQGSVLDSSCQVPAAEMNRTITLDEITKGNLTGATVGSAVAYKDFRFNITACPAGTNTVGVKFTFNADSSNPNYLANSGTATGVLLGITNQDDQLIESTDTISSDDYDSSTKAGSVKAKLKAYRTSATPVEGTIASSATIEIITN